MYCSHRGWFEWHSGAGGSWNLVSSNFHCHPKSSDNGIRVPLKIECHWIFTATQHPLTGEFHWHPKAIFPKSQCHPTLELHALVHCKMQISNTVCFSGPWHTHESQQQILKILDSRRVNKYTWITISSGIQHARLCIMIAAYMLITHLSVQLTFTLYIPTGSNRLHVLEKHPVLIGECSHTK
jgi:hypothetical protein